LLLGNVAKDASERTAKLERARKGCKRAYAEHEKWQSLLKRRRVHPEFHRIHVLNQSLQCVQMKWGLNEERTQALTEYAPKQLSRTTLRKLVARCG